MAKSSSAVSPPMARFGEKPLSLRFFYRFFNLLSLKLQRLWFNAVCRVFQISKNTLLDWEQRSAGLQAPLLVYTLLHTFLSQLIEGDEVYTKIEKNRPQRRIGRLDP